MAAWAPIPGWVGYYEASNAGEIRSLSRTVGRTDGRTVAMKGRVLRPSVNPKGYQIVVLARDGERRAYPVHRLIAETFLGPRPAGMHTCHNDDDKANNSAANLRYDTASANERDKVAHGLNRNAAKTECPQGHAYDAENTRMHTDGGRSCRTCHRQRRRAEREAAKAA